MLMRTFFILEPQLIFDGRNQLEIDNFRRENGVRDVIHNVNVNVLWEIIKPR